jgi:hypothetical protein
VASRRVPVMRCPSFDRLMMLLTPSTDQGAPLSVEIIANELTLRVEPKAAVAWRSVETR